MSNQYKPYSDTYCMLAGRSHPQNSESKDTPLKQQISSKKVRGKCGKIETVKVLASASWPRNSVHTDQWNICAKVVLRC